MIASLGVDRDAAEARAAELRQVVADVEGLHEPDIGGGGRPGPPPRPPPPPPHLLRGLTGGGGVCPAPRTARRIALGPGEGPRPPPPMPSLKELMAIAPSGVDRFFEALLSDPPPGRRR